MSYIKDKMIIKKIGRNDNVKEKQSQKIYDGMNSSEDYLMRRGMKTQIKTIIKSQKELLDNFRYYEDKEIRGEPRRKSIVRHRRLCNPVGKETPFNRELYKTNTFILHKRPNLLNKNIEGNYMPLNYTQNSLTKNINNYRYQPQTQKNIFNKKVQNPNLSYNSRIVNSTENLKKPVRREIIVEQNSNGEYVVKYGEEKNVREIGFEVEEITNI